MRFNTEQGALEHAEWINRLFAKRGHLNPVVHVRQDRWGCEVQEIKCQFPDHKEQHPQE